MYRGSSSASTSSRLNAKVSWVRSFVPKEKKSAIPARSAATSAALGVSIIVPTLTACRLRPEASAELSACSTHERARASSLASTTRGIMISTCGDRLRA